MNFAFRNQRTPCDIYPALWLISQPDLTYFKFELSQVRHLHSPIAFFLMRIKCVFALGRWCDVPLGEEELNLHVNENSRVGSGSLVLLSWA